MLPRSLARLPAAATAAVLALLPGVLLPGVLSPGTAAAEPPPPEPPRAERPAGAATIPGNYADPTIVAFDGTYYLYPTTDGAGAADASFRVFSSKDLVTWRDRGTALELGPDVDWAERNAWAPAIARKDGRYYFYYTADMRIGVAVGDSPTGPFTDTGRPLVEANTGGRGQSIDPATFTAPDGTTYLYWGNGEAFVVPLNADMVSFDPGKVRRIDGLDGFGEGLHMARRGGTYHLTWSIGVFTSEDYRVGYATATSPTGPFTDRGVILSKDAGKGIRGTGHDSVLQVPGTDEWFMAYHRFTIPGGDGTHRQITLDRIPIGANGVFGRVTPTLTGPSERPALTG
ncbi:MAG: family 43 glycosylhydrolase [Pseudonocardia sediminis]